MGFTVTVDNRKKKVGGNMRAFGAKAAGGKMRAFGDAAPRQTSALNRLSGGVIKKGIGSRLGDSRDKWTHDLFDSPGGKDLRSRLDGDGPGRGGRFGAGGGRGGRGGRGGDLRTRIVREVRGERTRIVREVRGGRGGRGGMRSDFIGNRGVGSVGEFLRGIGLGRYAGTFAEEEIDMDALGHLRDKDLQSMGLPLGPRKKIIAALK